MATAWWGDFRIPEGATQYWRIGPLSLWLHRSEREYRLHEQRDSDPFDPRMEASLEPPPTPPEGKCQRFLMERTFPSVRLTPRCADRPFLVKTATPLSVLVGEKATIYVSTPAWVQLESSDARILCTLPTRQPNAAWFGANTREGELCFASATRAILERAELEPRPARLYTMVFIENHAEVPLEVLRFKLPVNALELYHGEHLWTQSVLVERRKDLSIDARVLTGPPGIVADERFVSGAVAKSSDNLFRRTLGALLG
ncbi:MAG: hypothetical protein RBU37_21025 [Myxococcota bacterium]|jgi:hypothetical protein|nr:hypothetical protein [Myxococcota bacterium]